MSNEQNAMDDRELIPPGCGFFFRWLFTSVPATALGWALGWRFSFLVHGSLATVTIGITMGAILGIAQWLVLRGHFYKAGGWILATASGWVIGMTLGAWLAQYYGLSEFMFGLAIGTITGICAGTTQWVVLRQRVTSAGWWVPVSAFAWASSLIFYQPGVTWLGFLYGTLSGIVSGLAMLWLIYRPVEDVRSKET